MVPHRCGTRGCAWESAHARNVVDASHSPTAQVRPGLQTGVRCGRIPTDNIVAPGRCADLLARTRTLIVALVMLATAAPALSAQVIRGVVTEAGSRTPLAGALVTLQSAGAAQDTGAARSVITNQRGEYAIAAPGPGQYLVTVRRIGVRALTSDPLSVRTGQTIVHDVSLDPLTTLPRVTVADRSLCSTRRDQGPRVASLWEEARTALTVISISAKDSTIRRRLVRFKRRVSAVNAEIMEETSHSYDENDGIGEPTFRSLTGDSLSRAGYWIDASSDITFHAPDASALLSSAFLRDHCFSIIENRRGRPDLIGLEFVPVRNRMTPDIRGTLWLDAMNFELRLVDFTWTQLPWELQNERVGGEVHFMRLPTGPWIVKNWTLTMPRPSLVSFRGVGGPRSERLLLDGLGQEGGMILVNGLETFDRPGTITGRIVRAGKPLTGTRIRLVGTAFETMVDAEGRFSFDSVAPGLHAIVAEHPDFAVFGVRAAEQEFVLQEGGTRHLSFVARGEKEIADAMCPGRDWRRPTLRVSLVDKQTGRPLRNTPLRMRWLDVVTVAHGDLLGRETRETDLNARTDDAGTAVFCSLPAAQTLTLGYPVDGGLHPLHTFKLGNQENAVATLRASPP